jgi:hypothetical protein
MSNQCEGKTKSGVRCTKKTRHESKRCHFHKDSPSALTDQVPVVVQQTKPKKCKKTKMPALAEQSSAKVDCCVCLDEMPESDNLDCGHPLCRGCVGNLRNDKCPMCRRDISAKHITSHQKSQMRKRFQEDRVARHAVATQNYLATLV